MMNHIAYHLKEIHIGKKSGIINYKHGRIEKNFCFQDGNLMFSQTNQLDERLGEVLFKLGKISKETYSKIDRIIQQGMRLGETLVKGGFLSKSDLYEGWIYQMKQITLNIFSDFEGRFVFKEIKDLVDQGFESKISVPLLIKDGIRQMNYHPALKEFMEKKIPFYSKKLYFYLLTEEEKKIFALVDGRSSIETILNTSGSYPEIFWKTIYLLYCLDLIDLKEQERREEEKIKRPSEVLSPEEQAARAEFFEKEMAKEDEKKEIEKPEEGPPTEEGERLTEEEFIKKDFPEGVEAGEQEAKEAGVKDEAEKEEVKVEEPEKEEERVEEVEETLSPHDRERLAEVDELISRLSSLNYYQILNVKPAASEGEIKKAYFHLARKYHPDSFDRSIPGEERKKIEDVFARVTRAYQVLIDKEKRREYTSQAEASREEEEEDLAQKAMTKFRQAKTLYNQKRYEDALILLEEAVRLDKSKGSFFLLLALIESKISSLDKKAEEDFLKAIDLEPWNPECYVGLGLFYKQEGLQAKARKQFQKALELDPDHNIARRELKMTPKGEKKRGLKEFLSMDLFGKKK